MSIHAATALKLDIAAWNDSENFYPLEGIALRNISLQQEGARPNAIAGHPWEIQGDAVRRLCEIAVEMALNNRPGSLLAQQAAFMAEKIILRLTFPNATALQGGFSIRRYELFASDGDALHVSIQAVSSDALVYT